MSTAQKTPANASSSVSLSIAFRYWLKLGFISFGGPAGQVATDRIRSWLKNGAGSPSSGFTCA
ncbi:hypothetical protein ALON55S_05186 [Alishewanella longhuensis]